MTAHHPPTPIPQPFLHDLVSCVQAPSVALSGPDGQIRATGAQGMFRHDDRVVSQLQVDVDGHEPLPVGHHQPTAGSARFVGIVRHIGDPEADPTVRLERERRARPDGLTERFTLVNDSHYPVTAMVRIWAAVDFAQMGDVKRGALAPALPPRVVPDEPATVRWRSGPARATLRLSGDPELTVTPDRLRACWQVHVPPRARWGVTLTVVALNEVLAAGDTFAPAATAHGWEHLRLTARPDLQRLVERGVADLSALSLADPWALTDVFTAAGSPWFLTLFGRDTLWTARFALPLGTALAGGTLRTLARRQGVRHDRTTGEEPGKIPHEVRAHPEGVGGLPPVYYGTVDATALWICLLHDAWRWGLPDDEVTALLPALDGALHWLREEADGDRDGFIEYLDLTGDGLTNQGWKDSTDAIQFPDGTLAQPPVALSEAQAYAYEAATAGAALLAAFGRPGAAELTAYAHRLQERFRQTFWVADDHGRFPAVALEGAKRPVGTATSNMGHLAGTGLLSARESALVARRLTEPDLNCGYGLRTMSADAQGFNPLGYHTGTVWPHDTAIAVRGLCRDGHPDAAVALARGLLRAAPPFDYRLPELFAGTDARDGAPVLAYPAACRPQAWSAAATVALLTTALGLAADLPRGRLHVAPPPAFASWFPLQVHGLCVGGAPLSVEVDVHGRARVETSAPVVVAQSPP